MADSSKRPSLTVLGGPMAGTTFVLEDAVDDVLIGSDPGCRLCLPLPGVSPIHARLWIDESGVTIYDTHSPYGLYVNDERVDDHRFLRNADILWLGAPGADDAVMIQCRFPSLEKTRPLEIPAWAVAEDEAAPPDAAPTQEMEWVNEQLPVEPTSAPMTEAIPVDEFFIEESPAEEERPSSDATVLVAQASAHAIPQVFEDERGSTVIAPAGGAPPAPAPWVAPLPPPPVPWGASPMAPPAPTVYAPPPPAATVIVPTQPAPVVFPPPVAHPAGGAPVAPARPQPAPIEHVTAVAQEAPGRRRSVALRVAIPALVLVALGAGVTVALRFLPSSTTPATPPTAVATAPLVVPSPSPASVASAEGSPAPEVLVPTEEEVTIVPVAPPTRVAPSPAPTSTPPRRVATSPPPPAPVAEQKTAEALRGEQVASLLAQAESAASQASYDPAIAAYDEILKLDPQNPKALQGRQRALAARETAGRSFVSGRTVVQTEKVVKGGLAGFDTADVSVKKAPDFLGRIEFAVSPPKIKAGESYSLKIYVVNEGKKAIKISGVTIVTVINGTPSGGPVSARAREVAPQQRALLEEHPGIWPEGVATWRTDVTVAAQKGDSLKNHVTWR